MLIGQLSDIHLRRDGAPAYGVADTAGRLERTGEYILRSDAVPDLLILTGDLSDDGSADSYKRLRSFLQRLGIPFLMVPGNHDRKENLRRIFHDHPGWETPVPETDGPCLCCTAEEHPVRLIGLDTAAPGRHGGGVGPERLRWLESVLARKPRRPTLIFMHHPPFASGIGHMDLEPFVGRERLARVIGGDPQVVGITCGHVHRSITTQFGGRPATIGPAVGMQIPVDVKVDAPSNFILEPPGFLLHLYADRWGDDPALTTYTETVAVIREQYGARHPFSD